jgi:polysaccharide pyruvyl transferase WcaK-like protein
LSRALARTEIRTELNRSTKSVTFFGNFGLDHSGNLGNEITFQAILYHLRRLLPNVEVRCICTDPTATANTHRIAALPISGLGIQVWRPASRLARALRSLVIGIPNELYRWPEVLRALKHTDVFIIPGTGLLTDAYGLRSWGPYNVFKWSLFAKIRGCKLLFVSIGAGPIDGRIGKWFVRSALALADFRSYRDSATKQYLTCIGGVTESDRVYPDLAFSIVDEIAPHRTIARRRRPVVGLGVMVYQGKLSSDKGCGSTYNAYLEQLVIFGKWLLERGYDIRLLIGDLSDRPVITQFKSLWKDRSGSYDAERILDHPVHCVEDLLAQLEETDVVVATRFHNALLALALNKPVISISFHQKCRSLMQDMDLGEYCQEIHQLDANRLIEQFCQVEKNAGSLKGMIREKVQERRKALDEQYKLIFGDSLAG